MLLAERGVVVSYETGIFRGPLHLEIGDVEAGLTEAAVSVDVTYCTQRQNHKTVEPHAATVAWNRTVWTALRPAST